MYTIVTILTDTILALWMCDVYEDNLRQGADRKGRMRPRTNLLITAFLSAGFTLSPTSQPYFAAQFEQLNISTIE